MMPTSDPPARRPYRQGLRADATEALRSRILDALFAALQAADYDLITLDALAQAARTTRQTVIRMFGGKEGALTALFGRFDMLVSERRYTARAGDLAVLAHELVTDLERHGDFVLRLLRQEDRIPILKQRFQETRAQHLSVLSTQLAPLLERLDPADAETALMQARAVTDTLFWSVLRKDMNLDPAAAESMLLDLLRKIFAEAIRDPG